VRALPRENRHGPCLGLHNSPESLNHKTPEATAIYARLDMDPVRESMGSAASAMFVAGGVKQTAQVVALSPTRSSGQGEAGQTDVKKAEKG